MPQEVNPRMVVSCKKGTFHQRGVRPIHTQVTITWLLTWHILRHSWHQAGCRMWLGTSLKKGNFYASRPTMIAILYDNEVIIVIAVVVQMMTVLSMELHTICFKSTMLGLINYILVLPTQVQLHSISTFDPITLVFEQDVIFVLMFCS